MAFAAGIDGGGTTTRLLCREEPGQTPVRFSFGPFNLNSVGEAGLTRRLGEITEALRSLGECRALCIGAAGISNPRLRALVEAALTQAGISHFRLAGDHEIALYGALEGGPGLALIAGTGSVCLGKSGDGTLIRAGGWGHLIGDGGSGYALGRDALAAVARAYDGGDETALTQAVFEAVGGPTREALIAYAYGGDKSRIAALAPLVLQAAEQGDGAARAILDRAAAELTELAATVADRLALPEPEAALLGGLLETDTPLRRRVVEALQVQRPAIRCRAPKHDPAMGALLMAEEIGAAGGEN